MKLTTVTSIIISSVISLLIIIGLSGMKTPSAESNVVAERKPNTLIIGVAGHQGQEYYNLLKDRVNFVGFVQSNPEKAAELAAAAGIKVFKTIDDALKELSFDVAIMAVPHCFHHELTMKLLQHGKIIIKEKPLALSSVEIDRYKGISKNPHIFVTVQRSYQQAFQKAKQDLSLIGKPRSFIYEYTFSFADITPGWRGEKKIACGGVLLDMGYHIVDVVNSFFGVPTKIQSQIAYTYDKMRQENLEDYAAIMFDYESTQLSGLVVLDRHDCERKERFKIVGTKGCMVISPRGYKIYNRDGSVIKEFETKRSKEDEKLEMFMAYLHHSHDNDFFAREFEKHKNNVRIIENIYKQHGIKLGEQ